MQLFAVVATALALLVAPVFGAPTDSGQVKTVKKYAGVTKPDSYIVKLKDDVSKDTHLAWLASNHNSSIVTHGDWDSAVHHGYAGTLNSNAINALLKSPDVDYIEEDGVFEASATVTQTNAVWGLGRISQNAKLANQNAISLNFTYRYDSSAGDGVDIYVIDTGIFVNHTDFGGRAVWGATFGAGYLDIDDNGHGTHVAGTVGGTTFGAAKQAKLIAVKVLGPLGNGFLSDIVAGINYVGGAASSAGRPSVASMSLGGGVSSSIDDAVAALVTKGIHVVVAAGNDNTDASSVSPARSPVAVTVGATAISDTRASFSNFGSVVDVFAPGENVISAGILGPASTAVKSGTSMACPLVSGMIAVWISQDGNLPPASMKAKVVSNALQGILTDIPTGTVNLLARNGQ